MLNVVFLFLLFIAVLGLMGKLRLFGSGKRDQGRLTRPRKCRDCGRFLIGSGKCNCRKKR